MNATLQSRGAAAARDANRATTTAEGSTSPRTRLLGAALVAAPLLLLASSFGSHGWPAPRRPAACSGSTPLRPSRWSWSR